MRATYHFIEERKKQHITKETNTAFRRHTHTQHDTTQHAGYKSKNTSTRVNHIRWEQGQTFWSSHTPQPKIIFSQNEGLGNTRPHTIEHSHYGGAKDTKPCSSPHYSLPLTYDQFLYNSLKYFFSFYPPLLSRFNLTINKIFLLSSLCTNWVFSQKFLVANSII
jgi:hypothetical protein